jgi:hypothetical protein
VEVDQPTNISTKLVFIWHDYSEKGELMGIKARREITSVIFFNDNLLGMLFNNFISF